ncbi:MAG TPA: hypothetical protein VMS01_15070 [Stellaceae bacterium]|nr:hypothetical protein [Stellaceae bacterium]
MLNQESWARDRGRSGVAIPAVAGLLSLAAGIYVFATTTAMVIHGWSAVPYWDQWDDLILSPKQVFSPWLYSQHNEHRILFPRLFFAIDTFAFAGTNKFNFFCNVTLPLTLAGLIILVAHRHISRSITDTLWLAGIVLTLLFSAMQYENFLWGFEVIYFLVELAGTAGMICLVLGQRSLSSLIAAIGFSGIAVYTLAGGIIVPFLAIPIAFLAGRSKKQIAVVAIAAATLLALYVHGYVSPSGHSNPFRTLLHPGIVLYALTELGNPFSLLFQQFHVSYYPYLPFGFGVLGVTLFAAAGLAYLRPGQTLRQPELVFLGIAGWFVATAFLTALGRLKFGYSQALSSRYASPMLLFWLSIAMLGAIGVQNRRPGLKPLAMVLSLPVLLMLTYAQSGFVKTGLAWASPRREAMTALLANVDDHDALVSVHPVPQLVMERAAELRAQHLAVFAENWSGWLGTPLADHVRFANPAECQGAIDQVTHLPSSGRPQWRVSGWAWDVVRREAPERIVLADDAGRVVGYALTGYPPTPGRPKGSGWLGHFTAEKAASATGYALADRERTACRLPAAKPR